MIKSRTIRFFGAKESLRKWSRLLCQEIGREPTAISTEGDRYHRYYVDVTMTEADRANMMKHWYASSGTGFTATGRPYRWNDCVNFEER
jgi:hypothetical protein